MMQRFEYALCPDGPTPTLGLIVLQSDETLEREMQHMLPADAAGLHISRVPSAPDVSRETLAQMGPNLTDAARLLPPPVQFDVVGYGCTSGTSVIGADHVTAAVRAGCQTQHVTDPMTALIAACRALDVHRLAFLTPYVAEVSRGLRDAVAAQGINCVALGSFDEAEETKVAHIAAHSIEAAGAALAQAGGADALFLSCTNLRTLRLVDRLEAKTGLPVLSSNQVLAWHMMQLAGIPAQDLPIPGRLRRAQIGSEKP